MMQAVEEQVAIIKNRYSRCGRIEQLVAPVKLVSTPYGLIAETDYSRSRWEVIQQEVASLDELNRMLSTMKSVILDYQKLMGPTKFNEGKLDCLEQILSFLNKPIYKS